MVPAPPIITCPQWGARRPKKPPQLAGRPVRSIFHGTAGHASHLPPGAGGDRLQAVEYARALQHLHMDINGWNDSGHSFLVMRTGVIVQGRWGTVTAIEHGRMVVSAHCPGQNDQPGIEHEHLNEASLSTEQWTASVWLHAWIFDRCGIRPTDIAPHRRYYATACPAQLTGGLPLFRQHVAAKLTERGQRRRGRLDLVTRARFAAGSARIV